MLMNTRKVCWLKDDLFGLFDTIRQEIPECNAITFSITQHNSGEVDMHIFYHEGKECYLFEDIYELLDVYKRHQILFQKFDGGKICG